jgi:flagellar hook-length control protein FliK
VVKNILLEPAKLDTTMRFSPTKSVNDELFADLFDVARLDATQQSPSRLDDPTRRDRTDMIPSEMPESDEIVPDSDPMEVPPEEDLVPAESPPSDNPENETSENDPQTQDQDENTTGIEPPDSDDETESETQAETVIVANTVNGAVVQAQNDQQVLLSGLASQANAKTTQQQLTTQQNPLPANSTAVQTDATTLQNPQPEKINIQPVVPQVNQGAPAHPEQNPPVTPTDVPVDTIGIKANESKETVIPIQSESQVAKTVPVKSEVEKLPIQTQPEENVLPEVKKQLENLAPRQNDFAPNENEKSNRSRPELTDRMTKTNESIESTVINPDSSKSKGFKFARQNQDQQDGSVVANAKTTVSVEKVSDLQNLPEIKSPAPMQVSNTSDMQENVERVVRAARSAYARGHSRIQIRLEPPELGYLRVEIKQSADGLNLLLQATNLKAQQILQQNSSELRAALEAQGLQPRQIDIQLRLDLRNEQSPNQQQQENSSSSHSGSQNSSQGQGQQESESEPFTLWQDWQPEPEPESEDAPAQSEPEKQWQRLEFNALDIKG